MKPSATPRDQNEPKEKTFLKRSGVKDKRFRLKAKNVKRLRIFQSVHAGHIRGGHSFH